MRTLIDLPLVETAVRPCCISACIIRMHVPWTKFTFSDKRTYVHKGLKEYQGEWRVNLARIVTTLQRCLDAFVTAIIPTVTTLCNNSFRLRKSSYPAFMAMW